MAGAAIRGPFGAAVVIDPGILAFRPAGYWDIEALLATEPTFTAALVAVDGTKVATGKDFGSDGRAVGRVVCSRDRAAHRGPFDPPAVGVHRSTR